MSSHGIHPNINSIIRIRDSINTALHTPPLNPESAVNQMAGLLSILEPKDLDELKDTFTSIGEEVRSLAHARSIALKNSRIAMRMPVYKQWFLDINAVLWSKGYLENRKYFEMGEDEVKFA